jgi:hypothetical protein
MGLQFLRLSLVSDAYIAVVIIGFDFLATYGVRFCLWDITTQERSGFSYRPGVMKFNSLETRVVT